MDPKVMKRTMRISMADGALSTVMGSLTSGTFLTGLALALGGNRLQVGILASIAPVSNVCQLVGSYWMEYTGFRKELCVGAAAISRLIWLPVMALPLFKDTLGGVHSCWLLIGFVAIHNALSGVSGVAWLSWTKDLIPQNLRLRFFNRRNQLNSSFALLMSLLSAGVVCLCATGPTGSGSLFGFNIVLAFALLTGLGSLTLLAITPHVPFVRCDSQFQLSHIFQKPLKDRAFRCLVAYYAVWNLSTNLAAPFFSLYMLQELNVSFLNVTLLATVASLSSIGANSLWTSLGERFGVRPVVMLANLGDALIPAIWLLIDDQATGLLIAVHCFGLFAAPLATGPQQFLVKIAPNEKASTYMASFNSVVGVVSSLAPLIGGLIVQSLDVFQVGALSISLVGFKVVFALSFLGRLISLALIQRIQMPNESTCGHMQSVIFRTFRWKLARQIKRYERFYRRSRA